MAVGEGSSASDATHLPAVAQCTRVKKEPLGWEWHIRQLSDHLTVADIKISKGPHRLGDSSVARWMHDLCIAFPGSLHLFKVLIPAASGYVSCSNLLEQRLAGAAHLTHARSFLTAKHHYATLSPDSNDQADINTILHHVAGAVKVDTDTGNWEHNSAAIDNDLVARLSVPWILPQPIAAQQRVALIRGRMAESSGRPVYEAVASLGVSLVVIDEAGHWARPDTESNRALRESFIVADMAEDKGLVDRLIACIHNHPDPIHGVFTCSDNYFVAVAEVAAHFGFNSSPASAYKLTVDKHLSRSTLQNIPGQVARVSSFEHLSSLMAAGSYNPVFPVIVKPIKGWSSECVARVDNASDLAVAVERATRRHSDSGFCVVEPYFEGPEVDANLVMLDGKILFSEIGDEPPREGDEPGGGVQASFSDVTTTSPSALPRVEQEIVIRTIHSMLLKIGMKTGVFHTEARLTGSSCHYGLIDGVVDLVTSSEEDQPLPTTPVCRLIEINARPPGFSSSLSSLHAYGVNYFQLHALAALGDYARLQALSKPFGFSQRGCDHRLAHQAQSWVKLMHISAPRGCGSGGVLRTQSGAGPITDLLQERPELRSAIYLAHDEIMHGDKLDEFTAGGRTCVGHIGVRSTISRTAVTELGDRVRELLKIDTLK